MYTIITENDESQWDDKTGELYHFPKRYLKYLNPGTKVVYYKGGENNIRFREYRLSAKPHYFGFAEVDSVYEDLKSDKGDFYAKIKNYVPFSKPIFIKHEEKYIESIPESKLKNYWRDGVRSVFESTYNLIVKLAEAVIINETTDTQQGGDEFYTNVEGKELQIVVKTYERDPKLRLSAIKLHGTTCMACEINFKEKYGDWGAGFIHVHHTIPVSEAGERKVSPQDDMIVLCPNCHAMVHRKKGITLSIDELKALIIN